MKLFTLNHINYIEYSVFIEIDKNEFNFIHYLNKINQEINKIYNKADDDYCECKVYCGGLEFVTNFKKGFSKRNFHKFIIDTLNEIQRTK